MSFRPSCLGTIDPAEIGAGGSLTVTGTHDWTDYLGVNPWTDFTVPSGGGSPTMATRFLGTLGQQAAGGGGVRYFHGDLIGSTMLTTDADGLPAGPGGSSTDSTLAYTAFGEPVTPDGSGGWKIGFAAPAGWPRYQNAGEYGYEAATLSLTGVNTSLAVIELTHVGWRWYLPGIGRFVQRDPIGVAGGVNVYGYVRQDPLRHVEPTGLDGTVARCPRCRSLSCPGARFCRKGPPDLMTDSEAILLLQLTGGRESWLDDPRAVRRARRFCGQVAVACVAGWWGAYVAGPWLGIGLGVGTAAAQY